MLFGDRCFLARLRGYANSFNRIFTLLQRQTYSLIIHCECLSGSKNIFNQKSHFSFLFFLLSVGKGKKKKELEARS